MRENISPEEKLLRLIRGQKKSQAPAPGLPKPEQQAATRPKIEFGEIFTRLATPQNAKILLISSFIISVLYLIFVFIFPLFSDKNLNIAPEPSLIATQDKDDIKPFEAYLEGVSNRQIFKNPSSAAAGAPAGDNISVNTEIIKDISLVGVISGENPQAIMEDKKTQKTYYVTKGQYINEAVVEDIQEGKVILNYAGQKFELHL